MYLHAQHACALVGGQHSITDWRQNAVAVYATELKTGRGLAPPPPTVALWHSVAHGGWWHQAILRINAATDIRRSSVDGPKAPPHMACDIDTPLSPSVLIAARNCSAAFAMQRCPGRSPRSSRESIQSRSRSTSDGHKPAHATEASVRCLQPQSLRIVVGCS